MPCSHRAFLGYVLSDESLPHGTARNWVKAIGLLTNFKFTTIFYNLRYNAASEFDGSGKYIYGAKRRSANFHPNRRHKRRPAQLDHATLRLEGAAEALPIARDYR